MIRVKSNENVTEGKWFPQMKMLLKPTSSFLRVAPLARGERGRSAGPRSCLAPPAPPGQATSWEASVCHKAAKPS